MTKFNFSQLGVTVILDTLPDAFDFPLTPEGTSRSGEIFHGSRSTA